MRVVRPTTAPVKMAVGAMNAPNPRSAKPKLPALKPPTFVPAVPATVPSLSNCLVRFLAGLKADKSFLSTFPTALAWSWNLDVAPLITPVRLDIPLWNCRIPRLALPNTPWVGPKVLRPPTTFP